MSSVERISIQQIGHNFGDAPFGSKLKTRDYVGSGIPVIQGRNIKDNRFVWNQKLYVTKEKFQSLPRSHCQEGDLVFPKIGTIGVAAIMPKVEGHKVFLLSTNMMKMSVDPQIADIKYVYYYFGQSHVRDHIRATAGGSSQPIFNFTTLKAFEIDLPPLPAQRKIATVLSAYDDLIENNTRRIEILEELAQTIYREWFVNFRFPGHEKARMVNSELGLIPEGWVVRPVKGILKRLKAGNTYKEADVADEGQVPVIDQSRNDFLGFHNNAPDHKASPEEPIVIFGDHTCKMQLMVEPFSIGPNVVPFVSPDETPILFLYFLVNDLVETREYKRHWTELTNKRVVFPSTSIAHKFSSITSPLFEYIHLLTKRNLNLRYTRDLLLPKLISGEVDIEAVDVESEAEELEAEE